MGLNFTVDPRVLIPRPETEILAQAAIDFVKYSKRKPVDILDIGTGSGNIAVALAKHLTNSNVVAVDISREALEVALDNACRHIVEKKIRFIQSDIFSNLHEAAENQKFDIIVSNPPYIRTEDLKRLPLDVQKEPKIALDGGYDGLDFYRRIIRESPRYLKIGGMLFLEFGNGQADKIKEMMEPHALTCVVPVSSRFHFWWNRVWAKSRSEDHSSPLLQVGSSVGGINCLNGCSGGQKSAYLKPTREAAQTEQG